MGKHVRSVLFIFLLTFILTISISTASESVLQYIGLESAVLALFFIILVGVVFDIVGVAAAASVEAPFHAMASKKVFGAKVALRLVKNADKVSSFCNDVIGDICGTVSGALVITVLLKFLQEYPASFSRESLLSPLATAFVAALTVGGKAYGKRFAIDRSTNIILFVGKILASFERLTCLSVRRKANTRNVRKRRLAKHGK